MLVDAVTRQQQYDGFGVGHGGSSGSQVEEPGMEARSEGCDKKHAADHCRDFMGVEVQVGEAPKSKPSDGGGAGRQPQRQDEHESRSSNQHLRPQHEQPDDGAAD